MRLGLVTEGCACEEGAHYTGARARRLHVAHLAEERQGPRGLNRFLSASPNALYAPTYTRPGVGSYPFTAARNKA